MDASAQRIAALEAELDEMTAALAHAWDQLVPFLQTAPQTAKSLEDLLPVLETAMAALGSDLGAVLLLRETTAQWLTVPHDPQLEARLTTQLLPLPGPPYPFLVTDVTAWNGILSDWLFMPMIVNGKSLGALGVGLDHTLSFSALDTRALARLTERASSLLTATDLAEVTEKQAHAAREMRIASAIQRSLQPSSSPNVPSVDMTGSWQPAESVGGDAWGWVLQPSGKLGAFLLDVSGKGLPAALAAVSLHTALKLALRLDMSPAEVLKVANREFYDAYSDVGIFATVAVLTIDPSGGHMVLANAGHPPLLVRQQNGWSRYGAGSPPLGILPEIASHEQHCALHDGDLVVCYSDGFSELETPHGLWGISGIQAAATTASERASDVRDALIGAARQAQTAMSPTDDQTMLIARYVQGEAHHDQTSEPARRPERTGSTRPTD